MGINHLRKWSRDSKLRKGGLKPIIHHSIEKQLPFHCVLGTKYFRLNECLVGRLNGFLVTQIRRGHAEKKIVRVKRRIVSSAKYLLPCHQETFDDTAAKLITTNICRKRKFSVTGTCFRIGESLDTCAEPISASCRCDVESPSKKLKIEASLPVSTPENTPPRIFSTIVKELRRQTYVPEVNDVRMVKSRLGLTTVGVSDNTIVSTIPSGIAEQHPYRKMIEKSENDTYIRDNIQFESWVSLLTQETNYRQYNREAVQGWRNNFLRKCADIVEVRFLNAIRLTCVKPFYEKFPSCWREPENGAKLEESTLPIHQEFQGVTADYTELQDDFSEQETVTLIRNFFQISRTYNLKHPYLIASIQTGLETRKDLFDFNRFRADHQIVAKLCVNLPKRSALSCILQLRLILAPQALPFDRFICEKIVAHLFAGFGPDWTTISKLTGLNQFSVKTIIALLHNSDAGTISPQLWFQIHQKMLDDKRFAPEAPTRQHSSTEAFSFNCVASSSFYKLNEVDGVGKMASLDRKLPSLETIQSHWNTLENSADGAPMSMY